MPAPKGHAHYNQKNEGGRPVKWTTEAIEIEANEFELWIQNPKNVYFKRFALERGYSPQRYNEFCEVSERFSAVFNRVKEWQETRIAEGALFNELNSGFSKFFMQNVCNWREKSETTLSGDSANPMSFLLDLANSQSKELIPQVEEQQVEYKTDEQAAT